MTQRARRSWPWRRPGEDEPAEASAAPETEGSPPLPEILLDDSPLRSRYDVVGAPSFMFISLFGMTGKAIAERADLVDEELRQKGLVPVYLVDEAEFAPLRAGQRLFEYLPSPWRGVRALPDLDWPHYLRRRYLLLQAKWQPIGRIDFGDIPDWLPEQHEPAG